MNMLMNTTLNAGMVKIGSSLKKAVERNVKLNGKLSMVSVPFFREHLFNTWMTLAKEPSEKAATINDVWGFFQNVLSPRYDLHVILTENGDVLVREETSVIPYFEYKFRPETLDFENSSIAYGSLLNNVTTFCNHLSQNKDFSVQEYFKRNYPDCATLADAVAQLCVDNNVTPDQLFELQHPNAKQTIKQLRHKVRAHHVTHSRIVEAYEALALDSAEQVLETSKHEIVETHDDITNDEATVQTNEELLQDVFSTLSNSYGRRQGRKLHKPFKNVVRKLNGAARTRTLVEHEAELTSYIGLLEMNSEDREKFTTLIADLTSENADVVEDVEVETSALDDLADNLEEMENEDIDAEVDVENFESDMFENSEDEDLDEMEEIFEGSDDEEENEEGEEEEELEHFTDEELEELEEEEGELEEDGEEEEEENDDFDAQVSELMESHSRGKLRILAKRAGMNPREAQKTSIEEVAAFIVRNS